MFNKIFNLRKNEEIIYALPVRRCTCRSCGNEFKPTVEAHYIARDPRQCGFIPNEATEYDAYDCVHCGSQIITGPRKVKKENIKTNC